VFDDEPFAAAVAAARFVDLFEGRDPAACEAPWAVEPLPGVVTDEGESADELIGVVGVWRTTFEPPFRYRGEHCHEIGWRLAREWWGRGLVTEAAATCLQHARTLGIPEVVAFTSVGNRRSRAVMERLGMRRDDSADFDHPRVREGDPRRQHVVYRTNWG